MKHYKLSIALFALAVAAHCPAANVQVSVSPTLTFLQPGGSSFVDVVGLYDGSDAVIGGAIDLTFDASLLQVLSVTLTAPHDVAGSAGTVIVNGPLGTIHGIGFATFAGAAGLFNLASIEFQATGPAGSSALVPSDSGDPIFAWVNEAFEAITVSALPGSIVISSVPELQTNLMMLTGLCALFVFARRPIRRTPLLRR